MHVARSLEQIHDGRGSIYQLNYALASYHRFTLGSTAMLWHESEYLSIGVNSKRLLPSILQAIGDDRCGEFDDRRGSKGGPGPGGGKETKRASFFASDTRGRGHRSASFPPRLHCPGLESKP
jgi:hypothetical protein